MCHRITVQLISGKCPNGNLVVHTNIVNIYLFRNQPICNSVDHRSAELPFGWLHPNSNGTWAIRNARNPAIRRHDSLADGFEESSCEEVVTDVPRIEGQPAVGVTFFSCFQCDFTVFDDLIHSIYLTYHTHRLRGKRFLHNLQNFETFVKTMEPSG